MCFSYSGHHFQLTIGTGESNQKNIHSRLPITRTPDNSNLFQFPLKVRVIGSRLYSLMQNRSNLIRELNGTHRTQSNLIELIEPIRTLDLVRLAHFFGGFDCVRLSNSIEPNRVIRFDWVRLSSINRTFDLVRLVTSGVSDTNNLKTFICMIKSRYVRLC